MSGVENPPAFPVADQGVHGTFGMSLRDWFAGQAIAGLVAQPHAFHLAESVADAYRVADAMLSERAKPAVEPAMQRVAYFDDGEFQWMTGIKPRSCELYAPYAARAAGGDA